MRQGTRQGVRQGVRHRERDRGKIGGETGRNEIILGFRVPTTRSKKTSITTYTGEVSPPPANRTTIPYTFTELQKGPS